MSFFGALKKIAKPIAKGVASFIPGGSIAMDTIDALAGGASGMAEGMADNRNAQLEFEMARIADARNAERDYFNTLMNRESLRDSRQGSAMRQAAAADYVTNWRPGTPLSPYTRPLVAPGDMEKQIAADPTFRAELLERARFSDPLRGEMPTRRPDYSGAEDATKSSIWEKLLGIAGAAGAANKAIVKSRTDRDSLE